MLGGTCEAWFGSRENSKAIESQDGDTSMTVKKRSPLNADLFGSLCCNFQHGKFRKLFNDLTRVDARLDICSVSGFGKKFLNIFKTSSVSNADNSLSSPRLNLIFQQQVYYFSKFCSCGSNFRCKLLSIIFLHMELDS